MKNSLATTIVFALAAFTIFPANAADQEVIEDSAARGARISYSVEFGAHTIGQGNTVVLNLIKGGKPFTARDGLCFLTNVQGYFGGDNENIHMKTLANTRQWQLLLNGPGLRGGARCIIF